LAVLDASETEHRFLQLSRQQHTLADQHAPRPSTRYRKVIDMAKTFQMTIGEVVNQRSRFELAPDAPHSDELSLRAKQAVIDGLFRGMPIAQIEYHIQRDSDGAVRYLVIRGWPQLCAIFDFVDDKFPTWTDQEKREWEQSHESRS
jgi:hypothetical protein